MAEGELLLFCDDDIIVEPDHLRRHIHTRAEHGDALVNGEHRFSPETLAALGSTPFGRYRIELEHGFNSQLEGAPLGGDCVQPALLSACNLAVRRELFWDLGGFDEAFPFAGAEDQDLSLRATDAGCRLIRNRAIRILHNDPTVTFRQFCTREERSAQTAAVLARKFPVRAAELTRFAENGPITRQDSGALAARKLAKAWLSRPLALAAAHRLIDILERHELRESLLRRLYRGAIGLHIFRGYREALKCSPGT
jgi:GT2 family glycosyltransferase